MNERRIFLSTDECAAIRAGRKTQFRREIDPQPHMDRSGNFCWNGGCFGQDANGRPLAKSSASSGTSSKTGKVHCPFGAPGDRLWVPEGFALSVIDLDGLAPEDDPENYHVIYRTDPPGGGWMDEDGNPVDPPWQFAAAMPRWAARIVLEVVSVRVEKLQDISAEDCIAEGCPGGHGAIPGYGYSATPVEHYRHASDLIHGFGVWCANPWVWVVEFRRVDSPEEVCT